MKQRFYTAGALALVLLGGLFFSLSFSRTTGAQAGVSNFDNVQASGYVQAAGDVIAGSDVTVGDFLGLTPQTAITVTYQGTITPTGGLQYITATAARGTRLIVTTTLTAGTIIALYNSGAQTITLTDTAPLLLGGNAALGAGDTLVLFHNGSAWVQLSKTDN